MAAGISLLALAACNDDDTVVQAQEPPAAVEEPQTPPAEDDSTDDAIDRIEEGAGSILEGAGELARDARERTEELLEDAGPALERARDYARELGVVINEITERAMQDFAAGVDALEDRIDEADRPVEPVTGDADAVLAPSAELRADTRAAAQAGPAGVGPDYVGVWAGDAASCARIDVEPVELMAVITPTTIRRYEAVCNFAETPMTDGSATVAASCIAEGDMEERAITLEMPQADMLTIDDAATLVRCHLPE
ncbi:hypothetical protein [Mesorhizobium sp. CAU 1741]|uniref:hypothetical protein n=1 Tax=Mesorhizobium sp. CAU 1741 TaxID=3140366 RepID=UPI00325B8E96